MNLWRIRWETKWNSREITEPPRGVFLPSSLPLCLSPPDSCSRGYFYGSIDVWTHAIGRVYCFCRPVPDVRRICIFCTVPTVRPIVSNRPPNCSTSSISSHFCITMKIRTVSTGMFEKFAFFPPSPFSKNTIIPLIPKVFNKIMITAFVSRPSRIRIELSSWREIFQTFDRARGGGRFTEKIKFRCND